MVRRGLKVIVLAVVVSMLFATAAMTDSRVLKNPYADVNWESANQYIANFHSHTVYSDGRAEPDELIYNYAEAGYHILAITDHDNYHTTRDEERVTMPTASTTWPWTNWISEQPSRIWHRAGAESSAFFPDLGDEGMLAIRGNELSSHPHLVSVFSSCGYEDRNQTEEERMACITATEGLGYWAHPVNYAPGGSWEDRFFRTDTWEEAVTYFGRYLTEYDAMLGFEMRLGDRKELSEELLNRLLAEYYRDHNIFIVGSDDTHSTSVSNNALLTIVLAESLTEEAVRNALQKGHKFMGQRVATYPRFNRIEVDEALDIITVDVDNHDGITWYKDGEEYATGASMSYAGLKDAVVRFQLDVDGALFYSQSFYID